MQRGWYEIVVIVWSGKSISVDFIKTVSKSSRKSMYPGLQEQKERSEIDGYGACRTLMKKYKA